MRIYAVDPGKRTGVVRADTATAEVTSDILDPEQVYADLLHWLAADDPGLIVCESYRITPGTAKLTQQPWSLELIGFCRGMAHIHGVEFVLQSPAQGKRFSTDDKLRGASLWFSGKEDHARDAARHYFLLARKMRLINLDGSPR